MPEKVIEANDARWQEYGKLRRIERKLQKKILDKGRPALNRGFMQYSQGATPWNGGEQTSLAEPRTGEDA